MVQNEILNAMNRPRRSGTHPDGFYGENDNSLNSDSDSTDEDDSEDELICTVVIKDRPRCPLDRAQMVSEDRAKQDEKVVATYMYGKQRGDDVWVGRRIVRSFPGIGYFTGVIPGVITEVKPWGHRK